MPLLRWVAFRKHLIELADQRAHLIGRCPHFFDDKNLHVAPSIYGHLKYIRRQDRHQHRAFWLRALHYAVSVASP